MAAMLTLGGTAAAAVLAALLARRRVEQRVACRQVGAPVELDTMDSVLDVGDGLWRGPAPTQAGYSELAKAGCSLVVDLRAEADHDQVAAWAAGDNLQVLVLGTENTRVPHRDHLDELITAHQAASGATFVHCEAGEGRTGALIGAFQVRNGVSPRQAMADALAVGSLTFSQLAYIATGAQTPLLCKVIDVCIDRPTEAGFNLLR